MTEFSGWEMPVQFSGILAEHKAVRTHAGLFDISHMGKFHLKGDRLIDQLQPLVPSDLSRLQPGQAQYTVLLNAEGGILDDIIYYHQGVNEQGEQQGMIIVNAATRTRDKAWMLAHLDQNQIQFQDLSSDRILLALQGPKAIEILQSLIPTDFSQIPRFGHFQTTLYGETAFIARTGYTGEDGVEIMTPPAAGIQLWETLLAKGVTPCGLGARDTLRLEAAMCLYGQDITENTTPLEAGLSWVIHWDSKGEFIGRSALEAQKARGIARRLVGIQTTERYIARHGYPVLLNEQTVGEVTSGTLSPTLGKPIALAYMAKDYAKVGQKLTVMIRGKTYPAVVVKKPFYKGSAKV